MPDTMIPKPPISWNDLAAKLDPMMPQDDYNLMRQQYFATHVKPYVDPLKLGAYWSDFQSKTERPKAIDSPHIAQMKLAALSAGARTEEYLQKAGSQVDGLIKNRDSLKQLMVRDGISTDPAEFVGNTVPDLAAFAALEAGTEGLGGFLQAGAEAGSIVSKAAGVLKGTTFAGRVARSSLMFGTLEAATAQKGENPGYAFVRGMGTGAAWEVGLKGLSKVMRTGKGLSEDILKKRAKDLTEDLATPKDSSSELAATMGKTDAPIIDEALAQHVQHEQEAIRQQALPLDIHVDNSRPGVELEGFRKDGVPFNLPVQPYAEFRVLDQIQKIVEDGGQLMNVISHENDANTLIRTLSMLKTMRNGEGLKLNLISQAIDDSGQLMKDWDVKRQKEFLEGIEQKLGQVETKKVAEQLTTVDGGKPTVATPVFKTSPSMADLVAKLSMHDLPDGTRLSRAGIVENAKRIRSLWITGITDAVKRENAIGLRDMGVEGLVPEEWRPVVAESKEAAEAIPEEQKATVQEALNPAPEDEAKGSVVKRWRFSNVKPLLDQGMTDEQIIAETKLKPSQVRGFRNTFNALAKLPKAAKDALTIADDPAIPASDVLRIKGSWKARRNLIDIMLASEDIDKIFPGAKAAAMRYLDSAAQHGSTFQEDLNTLLHSSDRPEMLGTMDKAIAGIRYLPTGEMTKMQVAESAYHEDLHIQLNVLRNSSSMGDVFDHLAKELNSDSFNTMKQLAKYIGGRGPYTSQDLKTLFEEAFVHPTAAIRTGDWNRLGIFARADTSIGHVMNMVADVAGSLAFRLSELPDAQELRAFRSRIEDILRRTGPKRFDRQLEEALKQEQQMHYDPRKFMWTFQSNDGRTAYIFSKGPEQDAEAVANYLDTHAGFEDQVPSSSLTFERLGLTGPMVALDALPKGTKDIPGSTFMPKSGDTFKGLAAVSATFRPMLPWAADLDTKFAKEGVTINLFNKVKDVDDKFREGAQWRDDQFTEVAKFIPSDTSKAKLILPFLSSPEEALVAPRKAVKTTGPFATVTRDMPLSRTPKLGQPEYFQGETTWTKLAQKLGVDSAFLDNVRQLRSWVDRFQADTGLQLKHYLQYDLPKLQNMNYSVQAVWPRGLDKSELNRMARGVVDGDINPADPHVGHLLSWAIKEGFEMKYTGQPLRELEKLTNLKNDEGKYVLGVARYNVDNYIKYMRGIPDPTQQVMLKAVGDFQQKLGGYFGDVNRKIGTKLPEEFNYPGDLLQKYMLLSYLGGIGLRPAIWARDAMQGVTNSLPVLGTKKFMIGVASVFRKGAWEEAMKEGALLGQHNVQGLYGDFFQELGPQSGGTLDNAIKGLGKLLSPSRWGHNMARMVAYFGERDSALQVIKDFRNNKIDFGQFLDQTSAWFFDTPLQERIRKQLMQKTSDTDYAFTHEQMAQKIALETVDHTLWAYRRGTQPLFLRTGIGRIFGQYGLWPLNYLDFLRRMGGKMASNPKKALYATGLWYAANKAASETFSAAGGDVSKWFFISPAGYGGSPHLQAAQAVGQALENSQQGREARKTILEYPMNFIPAYLELKNVAGYISDGGQFFNDDWSLTDDAVRIMGMHPKSQELQLTPEEEVDYQAGFSHRR